MPRDMMIIRFDDMTGVDQQTRPTASQVCQHPNPAATSLAATERRDQIVADVEGDAEVNATFLQTFSFLTQALIQAAGLSTFF